MSATAELETEIKTKSVRVENLNNACVNWAVAQIRTKQLGHDAGGDYCEDPVNAFFIIQEMLKTGEVKLSKSYVSFFPNGKLHWYGFHGEPLKAAMRCYIAVYLGFCIQVPCELCD